MCVGSVCTHYNNKHPHSVFFNLVKSFPLSHIELISDVTQTQALPRLLIDTSVLS